MNIITFSTLCLMLAGCLQDKQDAGYQHTTAISVVGDVTDPKKIWIKAEPILQLYQFNQFPEAEAWFRLTAISDKQINPIFTFHLQNAADAERYNIHDDEQFRKKNILAFYKQIRSSVDTFYKLFDTTASLTNSECFSVIASELTKLHNLPANRKMLLLFTDLLERSVFDSYSDIDNATPQQIGTTLLQAHSVPDSLNNIQVILIYQPISRKEDQQVMRMIKAYKHIIESRGGAFDIRANHNF